MARLLKFPDRKRRRKPDAEEDEEDAAPRCTMQEIAENELDGVPNKDSQAEILVYHRRLMDRHAAVEPDSRKSQLTPESSTSLHFVRVQHGTLHKLLTGLTEPSQAGGQQRRTREGDNSFQSLMKRAVKPGVVKELLRGRAEEGDFGPSFLCNGTQLNATVANAAKLRSLEFGKAAAKKGKRKAAAGHVAYEDSDEEEELDVRDIDTVLKEREDAPLPVLRPGATITAVDPGVRNIIAFAMDGWEKEPSPAKGEPFAGAKGRGAPGSGAKLGVLSVKMFNHESGLYNRRRKLERDKARARKTNPAFAASETALRDINTAVTDRDTLLAALQARGKAAKEQLRFYSTPQRAAARFDAFNAERKVMERYVKMMFPTKHHILIIGDGMFPNNMRGCESGKAGKFVFNAFEMFPDRTFLVNEWRSTRLCHKTHKCVGCVRRAARARFACTRQRAPRFCTLNLGVPCPPPRTRADAPRLPACIQG